MQFDYLTNKKRSLYLIGCQIKGDRLFYKIAVIPPKLNSEETLMSTPNNAVKIACDEKEIQVEKPTVFFNSSFKIQP